MACLLLYANFLKMVNKIVLRKLNANCPLVLPIINLIFRQLAVFFLLDHAINLYSSNYATVKWFKVITFSWFNHWYCRDRSRKAMWGNKGPCSSPRGNFRRGCRLTARRKRGIKEAVFRKQFRVVVRIQVVLPINTACSPVTVYLSLYYYFLSISASVGSFWSV